jgi:uncharacterized membrane protein YdfJ with MMPL/SSD domain
VEKLTLALAAVLLRRPKIVLLIWLVVLVIAAPFAVQQATHLTGGGFKDPASQSSAVQHDLAKFRGANGSTLAVILVPHGHVGSQELLNAIAYAHHRMAGVAHVEVDHPSLLAAVSSARLRPDKAVVIALTVPRGGFDQATDVANKLRLALGVNEVRPGHAGNPRIDVYLGGEGALLAAVQADSKKGVEVAEVRAFPLIALVLIVVFGSLVAAVLPLSLGAAAVVVSGALIYFLSLATITSVFVTTVATMLGLGVAVDYSLFILVRYREEIAAGASVESAVASALSTSGVAVISSGLTVIAALAGLLLIDSTALRSIAAGAMLVVAVSVLVASTLLPALIRLLGHRAYEPGRLMGAIRRRRRERHFWQRWSAMVMSRPMVSVVTVVTVLLVLGIPALSMNIENAGIQQVSNSDPFREGVTAASRVAGPGGLGPVQIVVATHHAKEALDPQAVARVRAVVAGDPLVHAVSSPRESVDGRQALLLATLSREPTSQAARELVLRLRRQLPAAAGGGISVLVGGPTAENIDFDHLVSSSLWEVALFVFVLSFVVMVPLLHSIVLPLKAVSMTLLSVISAYGVMVAIFQWGWLGFLGLGREPFIDTITPPLVLVIAFGLSMDYEVFLLSRIREQYLETGDTRRAVAEALASTGGTITSAALIMVVVFLAFVSAGLPTVQRLGVACATVIALDATLVRLVLVPGVMVLLGKWNWWLPRPLELLLPSAKPRQLPVGAADHLPGQVRSDAMSKPSLNEPEPLES